MSTMQSNGLYESLRRSVNLHADTVATTYTTGYERDTRNESGSRMILIRSCDHVYIPSSSKSYLSVCVRVGYGTLRLDVQQYCVKELQDSAGALFQVLSWCFSFLMKTLSDLSYTLCCIALCVYVSVVFTLRAFNARFGTCGDLVMRSMLDG